MLTDLFFYLIGFLLSVLNMLWPNYDAITPEMHANLAQMGEMVASFDAFFPGLISRFISYFITILVLEGILISAWLIRKVLNFIRGSGKV